MSTIFFFLCLSDPQIDGLGCLRLFLKYNRSLQTETVSVVLFCIRLCGFSFRSVIALRCFFLFLFSSHYLVIRFNDRDSQIRRKQCEVEHVDAFVIRCSLHGDVFHVVGVRDGKRAEEP